MHFIITDWIHWKQYSYNNIEEAEEKFEECVNRARKNLITLTKCDKWYEDDDWNKIGRNWKVLEPKK